MTTKETKKLIRAKEEFQANIHTLVNHFHKENPGFEVYTITPICDRVVDAESGDIQVICTKILTTIKLAER